MSIPHEPLRPDVFSLQIQCDPIRHRPRSDVLHQRDFLVVQRCVNTPIKSRKWNERTILISVSNYQHHRPRILTLTRLLT